MRSSAPFSKIAILTGLFTALAFSMATAQVNKYAHDIRAEEAIFNLLDANQNQPTNPSGPVGIYNAWPGTFQGAYSYDLDPSVLVVEAPGELTTELEKSVSRQAYIIIEHIDKLEIVPDYSYDFELEIELTDGANAVSSHTIIVPYSYSNALLAQMTSGQEHFNRVVLQLDGDYKKIKLEKVTMWDDHQSLTPPAGNSAESNFRIILRIEEELYDDDTALGAISVSNTVEPNTGDIEFTINSSALPKPGWFQIEWAYEDNQGNQSVTATEILDQNATRIATDANTFKVTNRFNLEGQIHTRLRYVRPHFTTNPNTVNDKIRTYTPWVTNSTAISSGVPEIDEEYNWVYSASYAEEGKRVETMSYSDGTGRTRQSLTLAAEGDEHVLIAQESMYDYAGNPVIQIAPTPVPLSEDDGNGTSVPLPSLTYRSDLNVFDGRIEGATGETLSVATHPRDNYDDPGFYARTLDDDNSYGASNYYSDVANKGDKLPDALEEYIPDAEGFPYTYSEVDGSGRVRFQNIMGSEHHLVYDPEETEVKRFTKMLYGEPTQGELDLFFGNNAAVASNYIKIVTEDANGQTSVSIVDKNERPVFTGIGTGPENLDDIDSKPEDIFIVEELLGNSNENQALPGDEPTSMLLEKELVLASPCSLFIGYDVTKPFVSYCEDLCYECEYEYEVSVYRSNQPDVPILHYTSPSFVAEQVVPISSSGCIDAPQEIDEYFKDDIANFLDGNPIDGTLLGSVLNFTTPSASEISEAGYAPDAAGLEYQDGFKFKVGKGKYMLRKELRIISDEKIGVLADTYFTAGELSGCYRDEFSFTDETTSNADYECETPFISEPCGNLYDEMMRDLVPNQGKYAAYNSYASWQNDGCQDALNSYSCDPLNDADTFSIFQWALNVPQSNTNLITNGDFNLASPIESDIIEGCNSCNPQCIFTDAQLKIRSYRFNNPNNYGGTTNLTGPTEWFKSSYTSATCNAADNFFSVITQVDYDPNTSYYTGLDFNGYTWGSNLTYSGQNNGSSSPGNSLVASPAADEVVLWSQELGTGGEALIPGSDYVFSIRLLQLLRSAYYKESKLNFYLDGEFVGTTYIDDVDLDEVRNFDFTYNGTTSSAYFMITIDMEYGFSGNTITNFGFGIDDLQLVRDDEPCDCENSFNLPNPPGTPFYPYQCLYSVFEGQSITVNGTNPAQMVIEDFITAYQNNPEWIDLMVQLHPEYCSYASCLEINSEASLLFKADVETLDWDEFLTEYSGFGLDGTAAPNTGIYEEDALFQNITINSSSGLIGMQAQMEERMEKYWKYKDSPASYLSLEQMAMFITMSDLVPVDPSTLEPEVDLINSWLGQMMSGGWGDTEAELAFWERYKGMYLQLREEITGSFYQNCVCSSIDDKISNSRYDQQLAMQGEANDFFTTWLPSEWMLDGVLTIPSAGTIISSGALNTAQNQAQDSLCEDMEFQCAEWLRSQIMDHFAVTASAWDVNGDPTEYTIDGMTPNSTAVTVSDLVAALEDECASGSTMDFAPLNNDCGYNLVSNPELIPGIQIELMTVREQFIEYLPENSWTLTLNPYVLNVSQPYYVMNEVALYMQNNILQAPACPAATNELMVLETLLTNANSFTDAVAEALTNSNILLFDAGGTLTPLPSGTTDFVLTGTDPITCKTDAINSSLFSASLTLTHSMFQVDVTHSSGTTTLNGVYLDGPLWEIDPNNTELNVHSRDVGERLYCPELSVALEAFFVEPLIAAYFNSASDPVTDPLAIQPGYQSTLDGFLDDYFEEFLPSLNAFEAMATCRTFTEEFVGTPYSVPGDLDFAEHFPEDEVWTQDPLCVVEEFTNEDDCVECDALHEAFIAYQYSQPCTNCTPSYNANYQAHYESLMDIGTINNYMHTASSYSSLPTFSQWPGLSLGTPTAPTDWKFSLPYAEDDANWNHIYAVKEYQDVQGELMDFLNGLIASPYSLHPNDINIPVNTTLINQGEWKFPVKYPEHLPVGTGVSAADADFSDFDLGTLSAGPSGNFHSLSTTGTPGALIHRLGATGDVDKMWVRNCSDGRIWIHMAFKGPSDSFEDIWIDYSFANTDYALSDFTECIGIKPVLENGEAYEFIATYTTSSGADTIELRGKASFPIALVCDIPAVSLSKQPQIYPEDSWQENCEEERYNDAMDEGRYQYQEYIKSIKTNFIADYKEDCIGGAQESMVFGKSLDSYNNTLYFYDRIGNLTQTVPPSGVVPFTIVTPNGIQSDPAKLNASRKYRDSGIGSFVYADQHAMATTYHYNVLNEVVSQTTPDGGLTAFGYDRLGRIGLSQNSKQADVSLSTDPSFSYTLYDDLSRIVETGEFLPQITIDDNLSELQGYPEEAYDYEGTKRELSIETSPGHFTLIAPAGTMSLTDLYVLMPSLDPNDPNAPELSFEELTWLMNQVLSTDPQAWNDFIQQMHTRTHAVCTFYDAPPAYTLDDYHTGVETNLRNRVAAIYKHESLQAGGEAGFDNGVVYHYDISGNVKTLFREYNYAEFAPNGITKRMDYEYDQISGNVHRMVYQEGEDDQLIHRYDYDGNNRLVMTETSRDGLTWHQDATYNYYLHGPLESMTIGQHGLQSIEYAYTINGWLKLMNGLRDLNSTAGYPTDVFGQELHYYSMDGTSAAQSANDYTPIGDGANQGTLVDNKLTETAGSSQRNLYNGNIAAISMSQRFERSIAQSSPLMGRKYAYDQLNRIKAFDEFIPSLSSGEMVWDTDIPEPDQGLSISGLVTDYFYDGNGNITHLERSGIKDNSYAQMDDMGYQYEPGTNRLLNVCDVISETEFIEDIDPRNYELSWRIAEDLGSTQPSVAIDYEWSYDQQCLDGVYPFDPLGVITNDPEFQGLGLFVSEENYNADDYCRKERIIVKWGSEGVDCAGTHGGLKYTVLEKLYATLDGDADQFVYDKTGNLIEDTHEQLNVEWNPIGKVRATSSNNYDLGDIEHTSSASMPLDAPSYTVNAPSSYDHVQYTLQQGSDLSFDYDPMGERVKKQQVSWRNHGYNYYAAQGTEYNYAGGQTFQAFPKQSTEFYVRDATGNLIALYRLDTTLSDPPVFFDGMLDNLAGYEGTPQLQLYDQLAKPLIDRSYNLKKNIAQAAGKDIDQVFSEIDQDDLFALDPALRGDMLVAYPDLHGFGFYNQNETAFKAAAKQTDAFQGYAMGLAETEADSYFATELADYSAYSGDLPADAQVQLNNYGVCVAGNDWSTVPAAGAVIYVDADATGTGAGDSWTNAYTDLDAAITAASSAGVKEMWIAEGSYYPSTTNQGADFNIYTEMALYGGFDGTETTRAQRNPALHSTIISGDIDQDTTSAGNSYHLFVMNQDLDAPVLFDGLTITESVDNGGNGAILLQNANSVNAGSFTANNCRFINNAGVYGGGAIYSSRIPVTITNCVFEDNQQTQLNTDGANRGGAAIRAQYTSVSIENSTFSGHTSSASGGTLKFSYTTSTSVVNCTFIDNEQVRFGTVAYFDCTNNELINCSFKGNESTTQPYASIYTQSAATVEIRNSIFWGNTSSDGSEISTTGVTISNSIVEGGYGSAPSVIDVDPLFVDSDLRIGGSSPAANAGVNSYNGTNTDLAGQPRVNQSTIDMGAYEVGSIIYVDADATGGDNGSNWTNAYNSLTTALDDARDNLVSEVWIAEGTYYPHASNTSIRFYFESGKHFPSLYGGFSGTETSRNQRNALANVTVLSGDIDQNNLLTGNSKNLITVNDPINSFVLDGLTFTAANRTSGSGAALTLIHSTLGNGIVVLINDCVFEGNQVDLVGGAMYVGKLDLQVNNCRFDGNIIATSSNSAAYGGAAIKAASGNISILNTMFTNHDAKNRGGVLHFLETASTEIVNCVFLNNSTTFEGAIAYDGCNNNQLINCSFSGNSSGSEDHSCIFGRRSAELEVRNSIFWGNTSLNGSEITCPVLTISDCIVEGSYTGGTNILDSDPLFVDSNLRIAGTSPAANTGSNSYNATATDLAGQPRINQSTIDMGAYEVGSVIYVDADAAGGNNGSSWTNAFTDLQDALSASSATSSNEIWVAAGTYYPTATADKSIAFEIPDGVSLYGGFSGNEISLEARSPEVNVTILSGDIDQDSTAANNAYNVVRITDVSNALTISGFTVRDGQATAAGVNNAGGGFKVTSAQTSTASITISDCTIEDNGALEYSGGMYIVHNKMRMENCTFLNNEQTANNNGGGAIFANVNSDIELHNCLFDDNSAHRASAVYLNQVSNAQIFNCVFKNNLAREHTTVYANSCTVEVVNCSFSNNSVAQAGRITCVWGASNANLNATNCIFWGNSSVSNAEIGGSTTSLTNCIVEGGHTSGTNVYTTDPQWNSDLEITASSSAYNAGVNSANSSSTDFYGNPRTSHGIIDIGAYEVGSVIYVDADATGGNKGTSWTNAYTDLQDAMAIASANGQNEIWVAEGTYYPASGSAVTVSFRIPDGVSMYGGFDGSETQRSERNTSINQTILSGDIDKDSTSAGNSRSIVSRNVIPYPVSDILIDGFTFVGGNHTSKTGGAIDFKNTDPNAARLIVNDCHFTGNYATLGGGAIYCSQVSATITNSSFDGNTGNNKGGAVYFYYTTQPNIISHCRFTGNTATNDNGSAIEVNNAPDTRIDNCLFLNNNAGGMGTIDFKASTGAEVVNCTFSDNASTSQYASVYAVSGSVVNIVNSIFWGNTSSNNSEISTAGVTVSNSIVEGGYGSDPTVYDTDPGFASTTDLRIDESSYAYGKGVNSYNSTSTDLSGNPRLRHGTIDLGAYEAGALAACPTEAPCLECEQYRLDHPEDIAGYDNCLVAEGCNTCTDCSGDWSTYNDLAELITLEYRHEAYAQNEYDGFMNGTDWSLATHFVDGDDNLTAVALEAATEAPVYEMAELSTHFTNYYIANSDPYTDEIFSVVEKRKAIDATFMEHVADDWMDLATGNNRNSMAELAEIMALGSSYDATEMMEDMGQEWGPWVPMWLLADPMRPPGSSGLDLEPEYEGDAAFGSLPENPHLQLAYTMKPTTYYTYGSSRLGSIRHVDLSEDHDDGTLWVDRAGKRRYEVSDHLGNVRATFTDRKLVEDLGGEPVYKTDLMSSMDYYPFGAPVQERFRSYEMLETVVSNQIVDLHSTYWTEARYTDLDDGSTGNEIEINGVGTVYPWKGYVSEKGSWEFGTGTIETWAASEGRVHDSGTSTSPADAFALANNDSEIYISGMNSNNQVTRSAQITRTFDFAEVGTLLDEDGVALTEFTDHTKIRFSGYIYGTDVIGNIVNVAAVTVDGNGVEHTLDFEQFTLDGNNEDTYFSITVIGNSTDAITFKVFANFANNTVDEFGQQVYTQKILGIGDPEIAVHVKGYDHYQVVEDTTYLDRPLYRFAFNGQERDDEIRGTGNHYNFGARVYDPRLGRWLSIDPLDDHPNQIGMSPYSAMWNSPITLNDPDGECPMCITAGIGALVGGLVGGAIAAAQGGNWKDIATATGAGILAGAIVGSGAGLISAGGLAAGVGLTASTGSLGLGASLGITGGLGGVAGGASSLVTQGSEILQGEREEISGEELTGDILIGIPAAVVGFGISSAATSGLKKVAAKQIAKKVRKLATKEYKSHIKKQLKSQYKSMGTRQIQQIANQTIKTTKRNYKNGIEAIRVTLEAGVVVGTEAITSLGSAEADNQVGDENNTKENE